MFAGVVGALVAFALFTFPKNFSLGLHLERGKAAENQKRFMTAEKEFKEVAKQLPKNKEALGHLMIACYYNENIGEAIDLWDKLRGTGFDKDKLLSDMNYVVDRIDEFFPDTTLINMMKPFTEKDEKVPDSVLENYLQKNPKDVYGLYAYANALYDEHKYVVCDSINDILLDESPQNIPGLLLSAATNREMGAWDKGLEACNKLLQINKEASFAYGSMARIYLKQKKDKEGLEAALKACELNEKDAYSTASLALAYHFNNQAQKRDDLLKNSPVLKDSSAQEYMQYVVDVINQKEIFRN
jgi:tetratricopeptide (TPR) repeat protein